MKTTPRKWLQVPLLVFVLFASAPTVCRAQEQPPEPIQTDRPSVSQTPSLVPHKTVQLETGAHYLSDSENGLKQSLLTYPSALLRIGVFRFAELRVSGASRQDSSMSNGIKRQVSGWGPVALGTKVKLFGQKGVRPLTSVLASVTLPTGSPNFRPGKVAPRVFLCFANELSDIFTLTYNVGYFWSTDGHNGKGQYAIELQAKLTDKISVYGELFGETADGEPFQQSADVGILFQVLDNLQLDVAAAHRLNKHAPDYWVTGGVSVRLPR